MQPVAYPVRLEQEIEAALSMFEELANAYTRLNETTQTGEISQGLYFDLTRYANLRVETASTVVLLARNERVADALGLCRSLLEHTLLLRLMVRGRKYIQLGDPKERTPSELRAAVKEAKQTLAEMKERGEGLDVVDVRAYPRGGTSRLMWVREGLTNADEPDFYVSWHYFLFQDFRPEVLRLPDDGQALYMPKNYSGAKRLKESLAKQRAETKLRYDYYLSWSALLENLVVNGLVTREETQRIESHYTYLGQFLHPTDRAAQDLHEHGSIRSGHTGVGLGQRYDRRAVLLTALYAVWLLRGVANEIVWMLDTAPKRYISDPGTANLHRLIDAVPVRFEYFWFIDNDAPLWDRFNHAVHRATDDELAEAGGYAGLPTKGIHFTWNPYEHLKTALNGWSNARVGVYRSPLDSQP